MDMEFALSMILLMPMWSVAAGESCCERFSSLEAEVVQLRAMKPEFDEMREMKKKIIELEGLIKDSVKAFGKMKKEMLSLRPSHGFGGADVGRSKFDRGGPPRNETDKRAQAIAKRQLSHGGGHVNLVVPSLQVHEFPDDHTCYTGDALKTVLPIVDGAPTFKAYPANSSVSVAMVSFDSSWATTEIQSFPAPLKVIHTADCGDTPSLELPLDTAVTGTLTVEGDTAVTGTLTVEGVDVGAALGNIPASPSWTELTDAQINLDDYVMSTNRRPAYMITSGMVVLMGALEKCYPEADDILFDRTLPKPLTSWVYLMIPDYRGGYIFASVSQDGDHGTFQVRNVDNQGVASWDDSTDVCRIELDGLVYPVDPAWQP